MTSCLPWMCCLYQCILNSVFMVVAAPSKSFKVSNRGTTRKGCWIPASFCNNNTAKTSLGYSAIEIIYAPKDSGGWSAKVRMVANTSWTSGWPIKLPSGSLIYFGKSGRLLCNSWMRKFWRACSVHDSKLPKPKYSVMAEIAWRWRPDSWRMSSLSNSIPKQFTR